MPYLDIILNGIIKVLRVEQIPIACRRSEPLANAAQINVTKSLRHVLQSTAGKALDSGELCCSIHPSGPLLALSPSRLIECELSSFGPSFGTCSNNGLKCSAYQSLTIFCMLIVERKTANMSIEIYGFMIGRLVGEAKLMDSFTTSEKLKLVSSLRHKKYHESGHRKVPSPENFDGIV
ncbi:hypothetical protein C1H46_010219 [Malus baccata]|uniref:Uncharacterized protein n=1 Tax=Malus baccata TaxID=106549 RepID=A0A540MZI8_MALBA|nr:hypothetical protein C1H46_010219 [Malus baccata]